MHGTWIWMRLNTCQIVASGSHYKKFDTVENIKIGDGKYIQAIGSEDIDILASFILQWKRVGAKIFQ